MDSPYPEELFDEAVAALDSGNVVRALAIADQLVTLTPETPEAWMLRADCLFRTGVFVEAFEQAHCATKLAPANLHARLMEARAAWAANRLTTAQNSFEIAVTLSGRSPECLGDYAWFMAVARGPKLAEAAALDAIRSDVQSAVAWAALGWAQFRMASKKDAKRSLARAFECDPDNFCAQWAMTWFLQDAGEDGQAAALATFWEEDAGENSLSASLRRDRTLKDALATDTVQESVLRHWWPERHKWLAVLTGVVAVAICFSLPFGDGWHMFSVLFAVLVARLLWMMFN